jgi:hypothetical protein
MLDSLPLISIPHHPVWLSSWHIRAPPRAPYAKLSRLHQRERTTSKRTAWAVFAKSSSASKNRGWSRKWKGARSSVDSTHIHSTVIPRVAKFGLKLMVASTPSLAQHTSSAFLNDAHIHAQLLHRSQLDRFSDAWHMA